MNMDNQGVIARAKLLVPVLLLVAAATAGCGGSQTGTVEGRVIFEVGTTSRYGSNSVLQLRSHGAVVARQKVSSTGTYHFTVDPGTYSFTDLTLSPCVGRVIVRSGQTIHRDVICKPALAVESVVTGVATPCIGRFMTSPAQVANIPVTVKMSAGGKTIATQIVTGSHNYRFVVAPGLYEVSSGGLGTDQKPASVTVRPGEIVRANLFSDCL